MKALLIGLLMSAGLAVGAGAQEKSDLVTRAKRATAILVAQNENGGMDVRCTATAFEKVHGGYKFVSAAHCIGTDDTGHEKVASYAQQSFYITFDEKDVKRYYKAKILAVGYQHRGDDFSVFEVKTDEAWDAIPVGDEGKEKEGNPVINLASPLGLGIQVFRGAIAKMELDRPIVAGDINWRGVMLLQMPGTNGGSSGSAIISETQGAIVAFLVGTIADTTITAVSVSKFKKFLAASNDGKYRWSIVADEGGQN